MKDVHLVMFGYMYGEYEINCHICKKKEKHASISTTVCRKCALGLYKNEFPDIFKLKHALKEYQFIWKEQLENLERTEENLMQHVALQSKLNLIDWIITSLEAGIDKEDSKNIANILY